MAQIGEVRLKLLIDTESQKVLFAEADNNFINFLFNLLSLPLGTVTRVLKNQTMVGSLAKLYDSIETLNDTYLQPNQNKDTLLNPIVLGNSSAFSMLLPESDSSQVCGRFYVCDSDEYDTCHDYFADAPNAVCPECEYVMDKMSTYVGLEATADQEKGGFVKGLVSYVVMDDLSVLPMSSISIFSLLDNFNISKDAALEEKFITLDAIQGVKLLKASMESKTVLTNVFLEKERQSKKLV